MTATTVVAQTSKKYQKLEQKNNYEKGYIIHLDGAKESGLIKDDYSCTKVNFVSVDGVKKIYTPSELTGYSTFRHKFASDKHAFYKVMKEGDKVVLYEYAYNMTWSTPSAGYGAVPMVYSNQKVSYYVKKPAENEFTKVQKKNFSSVFADYLGDCADLKAKIQEEKLTHKHIKEIVDHYNYLCRSKQ